MAKVYVVTAGAYSDYHIVGVYSKRDDAESVAAGMRESPYGPPEVEEWELNKAAPTMPLWRVSLDKYGNTNRVVNSGLYDGMYDIEFNLPEGKHSAYIYTDIRARDMKHAIKIAHERWAQEKAMS